MKLFSLDSCLTITLLHFLQMIEFFSFSLKYVSTLHYHGATWSTTLLHYESHLSLQGTYYGHARLKSNNMAVLDSCLA